MMKKSAKKRGCVIEIYRKNERESEREIENERKKERQRERQRERERERERRVNSLSFSYNFLCTQRIKLQFYLLTMVLTYIRW